MKSLVFCLAVLCMGSVTVNAAEGDKAPAAAPAPAAFPDIAHADLKALVADKKVVLIDCNGSASYNAGHIPGAVDFQADSAKLAEKLPADKGALVVAYCGNPNCSAYKAGGSAAAKLGYTNVKHYSGGISGWKAAGEQVASNAAPAAPTAPATK